MTTSVIEPLDPNSDRGREVAARLSEVFADIRAELAADAARAAADARGKERPVKT